MLTPTGASRSAHPILHRACKARLVRSLLDHGTPDALTTHAFSSVGSFGQVILVQERRTGVKLALKVIEKRRLNDRKKVEHAMNERNSLQQLACPFTVKLTHAFQDDTNLYLGLEYVEAGDFFELLKAHGPLTETTAQFYGAQFALALQYLGSKRLIHRDIKSVPIADAPRLAQPLTPPSRALPASPHTRTC